MRPAIRPVIGALAWMLLPTMAAAENVVTIPAQICALFPAGCQGGGALRLDAIITQNGLLTLQIAFVALMVGMLFYYAATLISKSLSGNESAISESKTAFTYAIAGAAVTSLSGFIALAFSPTANVDRVADYSIIERVFDDIYIFFKVMLGIALTVNIVLQAFRLITSQGSDELVTRARERLIAGFLGVGVVLLANAFIVAIRPDRQGADPEAAIAQIAGVVNFLLTLVGAMVLGAVLIAGFLLLVSINEDLRDTAKKMIRTSLITLLIILLSFVILNFFIAFQ